MYTCKHTTTITILSWSLAPSCPPNSHYTTCLPVCSPTCEYLNGPPVCNDNQPCTQGCACDEGFVWSGRTCVPIQQCGCVDSSGKKYQVCECFQRNLLTTWIFKYVSLLSLVKTLLLKGVQDVTAFFFLCSSVKNGTLITAAKSVNAKEDTTLE